jgi:hypothetical protein
VLFRNARPIGGNGLLIEHDARVGILCPESFQEIGTGDVVGWGVLSIILVVLRKRREVGCCRKGGKVNLLGHVAIDVLLNRIQSTLDGNRLELCTGNGGITGRRHFGRLGKKVSTDIHESVLDRTEATISSQERVPNTL